MYSISVMLKPASGQCNMHCDYCFYCDEMKQRRQDSYGFMSEETLQNVIRKTMVNAQREISFSYQGGEPTLRGLAFYRKAIELQEKYNRRGLRVNNALQTNGYALNEEWCRFFAEHHFLIGLSIDGIQETHDAYRHGKCFDSTGRSPSATYERAVHTANLLTQYGVDFNILTVVNRKTIARIEEIYEDYRRRGWNYQQYILCLPPLGEELREAEYAPSPEEYGAFLIRLFRLWYRDWKKNRQPYIRQFENLIGMMAGYPPEACDQHGTCGIQYVAEADGSVYPCDFYMLDAYRLGNLNHDRLAQLDETREKLRFVERSMALSSDCRACRYYALCRGGCQRCRELLPGQTSVYRNQWCESYRMFFDACLEKLQEVAASVPPAAKH